MVVQESEESLKEHTSELLAVDGFTTSTVTSGEVATLKHEFGDDAVER